MMTKFNRMRLSLLALLAAGLLGCSAGAKAPAVVAVEVLTGPPLIVAEEEIGPPVIMLAGPPVLTAEMPQAPGARAAAALAAVPAPRSAAATAPVLAGEVASAAPRPEGPVSIAGRSGGYRPDPASLAFVDLTPYRQQVLQAGQEGAAVRALQSELIRKHGYAIALSGSFDGETEEAVIRFQAHMGLTADGTVGPSTWTALINHFVELPWSGPGFYRYAVMESDSSWGTDAAVAAVRRVAAQWAERGHEVRLGINDISLPHGGYFAPHSSHRLGRDVDFRTVRNDGAEAGGTWMDGTYSRKQTQELVDMLWATGEVELILFNDPQIRGVKPWEGHDDHLHVRFRR